MVPGYDTVNLARVQAMGGGIAAPGGTAYAARDFIFVGRFVDKKNLVELVEGYALYVTGAGAAPRRLVLIGAGQEEPLIRARAAELGVTGLIDFTGFLGAEAVVELENRQGEVEMGHRSRRMRRETAKRTKSHTAGWGFRQHPAMHVLLFSEHVDLPVPPRARGSLSRGLRRARSG